MQYFNQPAKRKPIVTDTGYLTEGVRKHAPLDYAEHRRHFWEKFQKSRKQDSVVIIKLSENDIAYAKAFAKKVIKAKMLEEHHKTDNNREIERWMIGALGEIALGNYLGVQIHDDTIGDSAFYNVPDLKEAIGMSCGVKAFQFGNFPLTNRILNYKGFAKWGSYPQIFIGISLKYNVAYLFGLATVEQMAENERNKENDLYVKDGNSLKRKTAFTLIDELHSFQDVKSLKTLLSGRRGLKSS